MEQDQEMEKSLNIDNLLEKGVVKIAQKPFGNLQEIPISGPYAIFFSEEDYYALSPGMWNKVAEKFGFDFKMVMLVASPSNASGILAAVKADEGIVGGVFGVGFKDEVGKFLDHLEPTAEISNSVNVFIKKPDGRIEGLNTDAVGFVKSLEERLAELKRGNLRGKRILILGAGGTGSAIAFVLASKVQDLVILNRTVEKAAELSRRINDYNQQELARFGGEEEIATQAQIADVIVNTTTKGATGAFSEYTALTPAGNGWTIERNKAESARLLKSLGKKPLICDIILTSGDTPTIALAKKFRLPTLDGKPMNLYQAIPAVKLVFPQVAKIPDSEIEKTMRQAQIEASQ